MTSKLNKFCELHVHVEGCVGKQHIESWWSRSEFLFPPACFVSDIKRGQFVQFLDHLRFGYNFLNSAEAYASVVTFYAIHAVSLGIRYAELQINYALLATWKIDLKELLITINSSLKALESQICIRFIIDLPWQFPAKMLTPIIDQFDELRNLGVGALSMGGDESLARPKEVSFIFEEAKKAGLKAVCHAGETTTYDTAKSIVETLEPHRITHAISIADWISSLGKMAPVIDVCISSNIALGIISDINKHPLQAWLDAGVPLSISTDDPAIFDTDLSKEYRYIESYFPDFFDQTDKIKTWWLQGAIDQKSAKRALEKDYKFFKAEKIFKQIRKLTN